jgi:hypothetical protein
VNLRRPKVGNRYYPVGDKELASVTTITGLADKSDALIPWAVNCAVDWIRDNVFHYMCYDSITDGEHIKDEAWTDARTRWREVRDEAGDIGTMVHDALEFYLLGKQGGEASAPVEHMTVQAQELYYAAIAKLQALGPYTVLATEQKVVNEDEWYAGRFDALLEVGMGEGIIPEIWLIDFKTGGAFYPEWGMQLSAYAKAWDKNEADNSCGCTYRGIDRIKVLRLDKQTLKAHWKEYGGEKDTLTRADYMTAFQGLRDAFYVLKAKKAVKQAWLAR